MAFKFLRMLSTDLGIDLGTANSLVGSWQGNCG